MERWQDRTRGLRGRKSIFGWTDLSPGSCLHTDFETWAGGEHPHQALTRYRRQTGIDARRIVVAMTSTGFTIADPSDAGSLDVSGFDAAVPGLVADFGRGAI